MSKPVKIAGLVQTATVIYIPCDNCGSKEETARFSKQHGNAAGSWSENVYLCQSCLQAGLDVLETKEAMNEA